MKKGLPCDNNFNLLIMYEFFVNFMFIIENL